MDGKRVEYSSVTKQQLGQSLFWGSRPENLILKRKSYVNKLLPSHFTPLNNTNRKRVYVKEIKITLNNADKNNFSHRFFCWISIMVLISMVSFFQVSIYHFSPRTIHTSWKCKLHNREIPWTVAYLAPLSMEWIPQAREVQWVAISFSRGSSRPGDWTQVCCTAGRLFTNWDPRKTLQKKVLVAQSCPTLCDPMGCSFSGSSLHGIFQANILEWVTIPFSRGSFWPRDWTWVSCNAGWFYTIWAIEDIIHHEKKSSYIY